MKRRIVIVLIVLSVIGAATSRLWNPPTTFLPGKRPHPPNNDPWKLVSYDPDNPYGTYLGNGFISTRIMGDGVGSQDGKPLPCYMAGLYDNEKLIPMPTWSDLRFYDGKIRYKIDKEAQYKQVLDTKTGVFTTCATWRAREKTLTGAISVVVSRQRPGVALIKAVLEPSFDGRLRVSGAVGNVSDRLAPLPGMSIAFGKSDKFELGIYRTKQSGIYVGVGSVLYLPDHSEVEGREISARVRKGKRFTLLKLVSASDGKTEQEASTRVIRSIGSALQLGDEKLTAEHKAAWAKLWNKDVIIGGPKKDQQAIHSCMFYILQSVREGSLWSVPPMGLSSDEFDGHIFWDADVWIFPALILQHPELARSIVEYRFNTLPGAMGNARANGYKGAEYAWESGYTGKEDTPRGLNYRHERHINGGVALAQWQYYLATGDKNWLKTRGFPVLKATADYWVSRVTYNAAKNRYEILKVVPPDENAEIVNNSVYTNAIAKMNLEFAIQAARVVGAARNPKWSEVAAKMYIPFDAKNKRFVPFDGYKGFKAKQADTELLAYPLQFKIPGQDMAQVYRNTLRFYQPRVHANGPAMSSSVHAVIAARLDDRTGAYKFWRESYAPFFRGPFNYFNEKPSRTWEQMCFLTGAAGPIQSALFGLAGIRMDYDNPDANLTFKPCLPKQWRSLRITGLNWRGKTFDLLVEHGQKPALVGR